MQIQRSFKEEKKTGVLYLVPTPIGNREDMSYRMVQTLKDVDLIAAEDTRNTGLLLKHFEIATPQTSFHEHNAMEKIPDLIAHLESGKDLAQVSDAGLPSISDPGHDLVKAAIEREIPVVAVPGPSAGITGLIASGLAPQPHIFYGFLPRKEGQQKAFFQEKVAYPETQIFYESPHRVKATLENMLAVYGDRSVVLVRELTKIYEEYTRGSISDPGHDLVKAAIEREIPVVAVPGPSAGITGLIASGLAPQPHIFYGFLPRKEGQQKAFFQEKVAYPETQIFYESPHRVKATLENMLAVYGDRPVVLVRELTKIYEEYTRGSISELVAFLEENPLKGECLLIVEGAKEEELDLEEVDLIQEIDTLVQEGMKKNQAIKQVAKQYGLQKSELYARYHQD